MEQTKGKVRPNLTEGPIAKTLFFFSLPILMGNVLQSLNGSINSIWVGKFLGEQALAATSNAHIILFFLLSSIFGIGMAATILVGQRVGAGDVPGAKQVVGTSALFFALLSIIVGAFGFVFSSFILDLMNTPADVKPLAVTYTKIIFAGVPFMFIYNYVMTILRGSGDSKTPFYFLIVSVVLDIVLNPVLIFGWGPFPKMDIAGSAFATFIAQFISLAALLIYLYKKEYFLRIKRSELHLLRADWVILKSLIQKGIPMGLQMMVVSSSVLGLFNIINTYGSEAAAAFGAASQLSNYVQMPAMAIGGAVTSMAAQNIGAGLWDRVHRITWIGVMFNVILTGAIVGIIHIFNREALLLFLPATGQAVDIGIQINNVTLWSFILFGIMFVVGGVVRSTGAVMVPLLITFIVLWVIRTPLAYYLGKAYGLDALWWSFPISFVIAVVGNVLYYLFGNWKEVKMVRG
ncbi:MATE family efflux transporter [Ectobacillus antri]|jgi:putative MATE family efflux protein|uniref:MATE family efflux transporter n=1 Tax=Ectobacillus antri TaxID=2486280 RepID=A0ABT6H7F1_9BACI|nr:MATE family efflux transporter [Ectobacillus antri]MDG4657926.1 MATE family efflux transporter [Ectobacillus antri]MDG5754990.1 MATE family efflux transporter [Ectobacillus antri]